MANPSENKKNSKSEDCKIGSIRYKMEKYLQPTHQLFPCEVSFLFTFYKIKKDTKTSTSCVNIEEKQFIQ